MKLPLIILTVFVFINITFAQKSKNSRLLVKKLWQISEVDGEDPSSVDRLQLEFHKNGTVKFIPTDKKELSFSGVWEISDDGKELKVKHDKESEILKIMILSLDKKMARFNFKGSTTKLIAFKKIKVSKTKISRTGKHLIGTWQISKMGDNDVTEKEMYLQFNPDGSAWNTNNYETAEWIVDDNGTNLTWSFGSRQEISKFELSKDKNTLTIIDKGKTLVLKRSDKKIKIPIIDMPNKKSQISETVKSDKDNIVGIWDVVAYDEDILLEKNVRMIFEKDMTFSIFENGKVERKGNWSISLSKLILKDNNNNQTKYNVTFEENNKMKLSDYNGSITLEKDK